jgi:replicative DNA helicase
VSNSFADFMVGRKVPEDLARTGGVLTGLSDLDALTGGMLPGLWLVSGDHGVGLGVWLTQLVGQASVDHSVATYFASPRDDSRRLLARLLSAQAQVGLHLLEHNQEPLREDDRKRIREAVDRLSASPLRLASPCGAPATAWTRLREAGEARLVVLNDAHLLEDPVAASAVGLRAAAMSRGCTLVLGLPSRHVFGRDSHVLLPPWDSEADVAIRLDRPDMFDPASARLGEIDLHVLRHRSGPTSRITAAFQGHHARIVDMHPSEERM